MPRAGHRGRACHHVVTDALGGYITGLPARQDEIKHAIALTILLAAISTTSLFFAQGDHWTEVATIFLMAPSAIVGGLLREKQKGK